METIENLKVEVTRLRGLLETSQREIHEMIREKASLFQDPLVGPILKLRKEVEGLRAHETDLLSALGETKGEMATVERTYGGLLDELDFKVAR